MSAKSFERSKGAKIAIRCRHFMAAPFDCVQQTSIYFLHYKQLAVFSPISEVAAQAREALLLILTASARLDFVAKHVAEDVGDERRSKRSSVSPTFSLISAVSSRQVRLHALARADQARPDIKSKRI